jgi:putative transposase
MLSNFPSIINKFLGDLPKDDYPVLDTFKFVSCWLGFVMDSSQSSMRDLFKRLNIRGESMDISTFSKASKNRDPVIFHSIFSKLRNKLKKSKYIDPKSLVLFPIDSTIFYHADKK